MDGAEGWPELLAKADEEFEKPWEKYQIEQELSRPTREKNLAWEEVSFYYSDLSIVRHVYQS